MIKGKRPQRKVQLPENWWNRLKDLCRAQWDDPETTNRQPNQRLDIYEFTGISRRTITSARNCNEMTEQLFSRLTENIGYASYEDLLCDLKAATYWSIPLDLTPPPLDRPLSRPQCADALQNLADSYLSVVIQGPPNSGKRMLAHELSKGAGDEGQNDFLLWYSILHGASLSDLVARLRTLERPLITRPGQEIPDLIAWLHTENVVLVLDGIDLECVKSFEQLLQRCARISEPARVIVISEIRLDGDNTYVVPPLSPEELPNLLRHLGEEAYDKEVNIIAPQMELWPSAVEKALKLFDSVDSTTLTRAGKIQLNELIDRLNPIDRSLIEILNEIGEDFDLIALQEIIDTLEIEDTPATVVNRLQSLFLIKQVTESDWRLEKRCFSFRSINDTVAELAGILEHMSRHYEERVKRSQSSWDISDLTYLYTACRLLQAANIHAFRRKRLIDKIANRMESLGFHDRLRILYEFEANACGNDIGWVHFKYARSLHVTGCLQEMVKVCGGAFHHLVLYKKDRDENLYISFLRLLAQLLIDLGHG
ncbi:MAG: hypothetical protein DRR42_23320, partial [Gammaproteobacteria bacterium]